ncbi:MAG: DinB family protein [Acidobacteria bacterium]|nr:DinB family protein [Acidobacteriota bacterium]
MTLTEVLISYKNKLRGRTMDLLKKAPEDRLGWRPVPGALSLGQLIHHIGQADMAWTKVLRGDWSLGQFLYVRRGMDLLEVIGEVDSLSDELETLEITHQELVKWIAAQTDEDLDRVYEGAEWTVTGRDIVLGLCEHESHHRGQIVTYLRLLEVKDPQPWGF